MMSDWKNLYFKGHENVDNMIDIDILKNWIFNAIEIHVENGIRFEYTSDKKLNITHQEPVSLATGYKEISGWFVKSTH